MALIRLGLRLAAAGGRVGRLRSAMTVVGATIGTLVLLLAVALAQLLPISDPRGYPTQRWSAFTYRNFQFVVVLFLAAAVVVLLATVARLSATARDRRLAGLHLLGVTAGRTRTVAAVEAAVLALTGSVLGVPAFFLLRWAIQDTNFAGVERFGAQLQASWLAAVGSVVALTLLAVVVSLAPTRRITADPLGVRRDTAPSRPRLWRLIPLCIGVAMLANAGIRPYGTDEYPHPIWWLVGVPLAAAGLPLALPLAVRLIADQLARRSPVVWLRLAGRRLQLEPGASTRVVAAMVTGLMLVIAFQAVIASNERTPAYQQAVQNEVTGPQEVFADTTVPFTRDEFLAVPGVHSVRPIRSALYAPGSCHAAEHACADAFIGTCADLMFFMPGLERCSDDTVALLGAKIQPPPGPIKFVAWGPGGQGVGPEIPFSVKATQRWELDEKKNQKPSEFEGGGSSSEAWSVFVPIDTPGLPPAVAFPDAWRVRADGGPAVRERLAQKLHERDPAARVDTLSDTEILALVPRLHAILWAATWVVLLVGFLALALAATDRAAERRRSVVGMHVLGVPASVVRRSQLIQTLLPIAIGIPIGAALGLLAGRGYLQYIDAPYTPVRMAVAVTAGAFGLGVVLAVATVPVMSRSVAAEHLRRE